MVMGVFAEIRNGFECFCKCNIFVFQILGKEKPCSILVFGNACFNIIVRINHDNVASRGAVGRTHTIVRLQTRIRRKMERRTSGVSCMCWMDFHNVILCGGFLCASLFCVYFVSRLSLSLFSGYHAIVLSSIPRLSHLSYLAPPHT